MTFQDEDIQTLIGICTKYKGIFNPSYAFNKRKVIKFQPRVETRKLGFRNPNTAKYPPARVKLIRCTLKYAFIDLGTGISGFVLENDKNNNELFYIRDEFEYKNKKPFSSAGQPLLQQPGSLYPGQQGYQAPSDQGSAMNNGQPVPAQNGDHYSQLGSGPPTPVGGSIPFNGGHQQQQQPAMNMYNGNHVQMAGSYPPVPQNQINPQIPSFPQNQITPQTPPNVYPQQMNGPVSTFPPHVNVNNPQ